MEQKKSLSYAGLILVALLWGVSSLITLQFYQYGDLSLAGLGDRKKAVVKPQPFL